MSLRDLAETLSDEDTAQHVDDTALPAVAAANRTAALAARAVLNPEDCPYCKAAHRLLRDVE